jgi:hypothetical protein
MARTAYKKITLLGSVPRDPEIVRKLWVDLDSLQHRTSPFRLRPFPIHRYLLMKQAGLSLPPPIKLVARKYRRRKMDKPHALILKRDLQQTWLVVRWHIPFLRARLIQQRLNDYVPARKTTSSHFLLDRLPGATQKEKMSHGG